MTKNKEFQIPLLLDNNKPLNSIHCDKELEPQDTYWQSILGWFYIQYNAIDNKRFARRLLSFMIPINLFYKRSCRSELVTSDIFAPLTMLLIKLGLCLLERFRQIIHRRTLTILWSDFLYLTSSARSDWSHQILIVYCIICINFFCG